jgi:hypothetical protein
MSVTTIDKPAVIVAHFIAAMTTHLHSSIYSTECDWDRTLYNVPRPFRDWLVNGQEG